MSHVTSTSFAKATALLLAAAAALPVLAQDKPAPTAGSEPPKPATDQVIVPQVDRRDVKLPRFASYAKDVSVAPISLIK